MALYDHRVFRVGSEWWVAQVHGASGAGWSSDPPITSERVMFRSLEDEAKGRTITIPPGILNRLSHSAVRDLLDRAKPIKHGLSMHPYNAPPWDEFRNAKPYIDDEDLRWVVRAVRTVRKSGGGIEERPALEVICLDDSALHKEVFLDDEFTYEDAKRFGPGDIDAGLVSAVKGLFEPFPEDFYEKKWSGS